MSELWELDSEGELLELMLDAIYSTRHINRSMGKLLPTQVVRAVCSKSGMNTSVICFQSLWEEYKQSEEYRQYMLTVVYNNSCNNQSVL